MAAVDLNVLNQENLMTGHLGDSWTCLTKGYWVDIQYINVYWIIV